MLSARSNLIYEPRHKTYVMNPPLDTCSLILKLQNAVTSMLEFRTQGFNGYAVKYSPFFDSRLAVTTSANFGLVGNGRLHILGLTPNGIVSEKWFFPS